MLKVVKEDVGGMYGKKEAYAFSIQVYYNLKSLVWIVYFAVVADVAVFDFMFYF